MNLKVLTLAAASAFVMPLAASAADVAIDIAGVRTADGPLYVSLQTAAQFKQPAGSAGTIVQNPSAGTVSVVIPGVAPGEYSVSVWHDIDGDGQFDRAENGRPLDGWSMLNAASLRGEPSFESVKFAVTDAGAKLALQMMYAD